MDYDIIATLGPASASQGLWQAMLAAGATGFRLNTSHLTRTALGEWLERIAAYYDGLEYQPPLVLDLQGSKWRLGNFAAFEMQEGEQVEVALAVETRQPNLLPVPHRDFFKAAGLSNGEIVLNDAKVRLAVESTGADSLKARVTQGGPIAPNKGITLTQSTYRVESFSEKDRAILEETGQASFIRYAISYVKDAAEMERYRALVREQTARPAWLIAKLERREAVAEAKQVAASADEVWMCRGDLGAELGLRGMAEAVHQFSGLVERLGKPAIMAGQVLEHMTGQPTPTRSEVCYLHDALVQGYRGVVLSDETAIGRYPVESCRAAALFKQVV